MEQEQAEAFNSVVRALEQVTQSEISNQKSAISNQQSAIRLMRAFRQITQWRNDAMAQRFLPGRSSFPPRCAMLPRYFNFATTPLPIPPDCPDTSALVSPPRHHPTTTSSKLPRASYRELRPPNA